MTTRRSSDEGNQRCAARSANRIRTVGISVVSLEVAAGTGLAQG